MHRLLQRQLKRARLNEAEMPADIGAFVRLVDEAYGHFDDEREILPRDQLR